MPYMLVWKPHFTQRFSFSQVKLVYFLLEKLKFLRKMVFLNSSNRTKIQQVYGSGYSIYYHL
jgi:hypothetical protein